MPSLDTKNGLKNVPYNLFLIFRLGKNFRGGGQNSQMEGADFASQKFATNRKISQNFAKFRNILFCTKIPFNPTSNRQRQCAGCIFTSIKPEMCDVQTKRLQTYPPHPR